jgi:uncharacterized membrane protein YjjP (DUF1212 family)
LLQYNESTGAIHRVVTDTARALAGENCKIVVSYYGVAVTLCGKGPVLLPIREICYNTAVLTQIHNILQQVRRDQLDAATALERLQHLEMEAPRHPPWLVALLLAVGAAALASLLGADFAAVTIAGVSTAFGLAVRHSLYGHDFSLLASPFAAAFTGSVLGGLAIHLRWTNSPELALIVPCLMLIPGPHLINGLLDLIDNYVPMSLARLGLAIGIVVAAGLGLVVGVELSIPAILEATTSIEMARPSFVVDILLAAAVTAGFAAYYNTPWPLIGLAMLGGALGHGLRSLTLDDGWSVEAATFVGGLTVGVIAAWIAQKHNTPVAAIAFAGAVTMMPGLQIYGALRGAVQLTRLQTDTDMGTITTALANGVQSATVVIALGLGLIIATRIVQWLPNFHRHRPKQLLPPA